MEEKSSGKLTSLMVFYNDTINSKFAKLQIVFFLRFLFCQTTLNRYTGTLNKQSIHHDFEIIIRLQFALIFIGWVHYSNAPLFLLLSCLALCSTTMQVQF